MLPFSLPPCSFDILFSAADGVVSAPSHEAVVYVYDAWPQQQLLISVIAHVLLFGAERQNRAHGPVTRAVSAFLSLVVAAVLPAPPAAGSPADSDNYRHTCDNNQHSHTMRHQQHKTYLDVLANEITGADFNRSYALPVVHSTEGNSKAAMTSTGKYNPLTPILS